MPPDDWENFDWEDPNGIGAPDFLGDDNPPHRNGRTHKGFTLRFRWKKSIVSKYGPNNTSITTVLLVLETWMNGNGKCWPSQQKIASACGWSREHTNRMLKEAERAGWIQIERGAAPGGSNIYQATIPLAPSQQWPHSESEISKRGDPTADEADRKKGRRTIIHLEHEPPF
jgi:hypothetical protein